VCARVRARISYMHKVRVRTRAHVYACNVSARDLKSCHQLLFCKQKDVPGVIIVVIKSRSGRDYYFVITRARTIF